MAEEAILPSGHNPVVLRDVQSWESAFKNLNECAALSVMICELCLAVGIQRSQTSTDARFAGPSK